MMISIPPKYAVSQVVGFMKGKSAIHLARNPGEYDKGGIVRWFDSQESVMGRLVAAGLCFLVLAGCSGTTFDESKTGNGEATVSPTGRVMGGQQPVTGAAIELYAVGTAGDGSAATALLTSAVATDGSGNFSITNKYTCPTQSTLVYLVSTGGNPGMAQGTNNAALSLMAALGTCGSLSASTYVVVNEATTVGSIAALYPYMSGFAAIGSGTGDAATLATAFTTVGEYTNTATGVSPGPTLPSGSYASSTEIDTLADIVSTCVNTSGGVANDGSACGNLFALVKPSASPAPTDVIGAVLDILNSPSSNVDPIFALAPSANAPFQPTLATAPTNWALPIVTTAPVITSVGPSYIVFGGKNTISATVYGFNFSSSSTVQVNGVTHANTYNLSNYPESLGISIAPADYASPGTLMITVTNPGPGGYVSAPQTITIVPSNTPIITNVPSGPFFADSPTTTILVSGIFLTTTTQIQWNGVPLTTTPYVPGVLLATVPASLFGAAGTANVTAYNPATTPTTSANFPVSIVNPPAPTISSISPSVGPINTQAQVNVTGANFTMASSLTVNGNPVPVTVTGTCCLTATVPAASLATPGNYSFVVTTAAPGGGISAATAYTAYVPLSNNSMVYSPLTGLLYASVPGSAGAPYGNSIVPVDPATGAFGPPIFVGSEPDKLALTADGRYLWGGLDGAGAVRKVDLVAGTAGLQFPVQGSSPILSNAMVSALAALPGATDSVVVSTNSYPAAIYDNGILRGTLGPTCTDCPTALQVDGTKSEIYGAAQQNYFVYSYNASGVTLKTDVEPVYLTYTTDDPIQLLAGTIYTDHGYAYNAETGAVVSPRMASGPSFADSTLGKYFALGMGTATEIQIFNLSDYSVAGNPISPISIINTTVGSVGPDASRLVRWGSNGLAFRTAGGIYSVRSNSVSDLSSVNADLGISVGASGGTTTGATTTYTATVTNAGPVAATNVVFTGSAPSTGTVVSATTSQGSCVITSAVTCDLGGLSNGASSTVTVVVNQLTAGMSTLTAQVTGSENDPNTTNSQASATVTITGSTCSPVPVATTVSPAVILAGSSDTTITVTGSGFTNASTVLIGAAPVPTSLVSATQLSATVSAAQLTTLGWTPVSVSNAAPGGGTSSPLALSIYSVIAAGANHIVYDPYTRKVMASIGSGANTNSIVALTPDTATLGTAVPIGSGPSGLALSPDGQILYVALTGDSSVARFNMLTQQPDFTAAVGYGNYSVALGRLAVQPGTENTIALDMGPGTGDAIYDFNPTTKTAALRGQPNGSGYSACPQFLDANDLLTTPPYDESALVHWIVPTGGFVMGSFANVTGTNFNGFACVVASDGLAYGTGGGIANPNTVPATPVGTFPVTIYPGNYESNFPESGFPDSSLGRSFFVATVTSPCYPCETPDGIVAYNQQNLLVTDIADLKMSTIETANYSSVDLVRWGQDGLAALTSSGRIYLLRGPVVVPQLLQQNAAAMLTSSSASTIAHGSGNTLLTLTGSNFVPGVAATWNGSYRTTTIVDATHVTVAIPASDLTSVGTATVVVTNPGAASSSGLTITIN